MQIFKAFFIIVKKNLVSISIYFGIFLALSIIFTKSAEDNTSAQFKQSEIKIGIIDYDNTKVSQALTAYLETLHTRVDIKTDQEAMAEELFYLNVEYILEIPKGFEAGFLKEGVNQDTLPIKNYKSPDTISDAFINMQINQFLTNIHTYLKADYSIEEALSSAKEVSKLSAEVSFLEKEGTGVGKSYSFFIYLPYIFIAILMNGLGPVLIKFNNKNIDNRIKCSSLALGKKNMWLTISSFALSLLCYFIFMLLAILFYKEEMFSLKGYSYMANSFVFLLVAISITYFVSLFVKNQNSFNMICNVVGLGMSFLGGVYVPLEYLSKEVIQFSRFLPTYWYVKVTSGLNGIGSEAVSSREIGLFLGIEFCFALAIFAATLVCTKIKSKN